MRTVCCNIGLTDQDKHYDSNLLVIVLQETPQQGTGSRQHDLVSLDHLPRLTDQAQVHQALVGLQGGEEGGLVVTVQDPPHVHHCRPLALD